MVKDFRGLTEIFFLRFCWRHHHISAIISVDYGFIHADLWFFINTRLVSILAQIWSTFALQKAHITDIATNIINLSDDSFSILVYTCCGVRHPQCDHFSESGRFKEMTQRIFRHLGDEFFSRNIELFLSRPYMLDEGLEDFEVDICSHRECHMQHLDLCFPWASR